MNQNFIPFYGPVILHCMDIPNFVYPFISWWTFGFPPCMKNAAVDFIYKFLCGHRFSCFLVRHLGMELLSHTAALCLFEELPDRSPKWLHPITFSLEVIRGSLILHIPAYNWYFLIIPILVGMKWNSLWFWFAFPCAYWSLVYLLWMKVCWAPLLIFKLGCLLFHNKSLWAFILYELIYYR